MIVIKIEAINDTQYRDTRLMSTVFFKFESCAWKLWVICVFSLVSLASQYLISFSRVCKIKLSVFSLFTKTDTEPSGVFSQPITLPLTLEIKESSSTFTALCHTIVEIEFHVPSCFTQHVQTVLHNAVHVTLNLGESLGAETYCTPVACSQDQMIDSN